MVDSKNIHFWGIVLTLLLAACSPAQPTENPAEEPVVQTEQPAIPPPAAPIETPQEEVAEEPVETEEPADDQTYLAASSEETSACLDCRSDQAKLMETADPVEEVESENEVAGRGGSVAPLET